MSTIKNNTTELQNILNTINNLPEAGSGGALPALTNEGTTSDLMATKELIDGNGKKITGTFSIDSELSTQDNLITQIQTALGGKATASPKLQEKTATPTTSMQTITPDSTYDGLSKVTVNAMPTATQATPSISVSSDGLITASTTQSAGYVASGTKSATKQLTVQAAKTVTPTTSNQTAVASGRYTTGAITVKGDANLKAENIAEGVSIFGITGTHSGGSSGGGSGANFETSIVTMNIPTECIYLSTDFQPKQEITSTFETVKNSIAYIGGAPVSGSGYTTLVVNGGTAVTTTKAAVQFIEASVNIVIYIGGGQTGGGAD